MPTAKTAKKYLFLSLDNPTAIIANVGLDVTARIQILSLDTDLGPAGLWSVTRLNVGDDGIDKGVVGATLAAEVLDFDQNGSTS